MLYLSAAVYGFILFSASSWGGVDGSRIRGANQQGDRALEGFSEQVGNVFCGSWNKCGVNVGLADLDEKQAVRCCSSDASLLSEGWKFTCISGITDVFGASPGCKKLPYLEAKAHCESFSGGRLCTYDEMKAKCTRNSGCGYDRQLVWGESLQTCISNSGSCTAKEPGACCSGFCDTATLQCVDAPTSSPSAAPTTSPSASPTPNPTDSPSVAPTPAPSASPTSTPSSSPSISPTNSPSASPTSSPSSSPSVDLPDEGDLLHTIWTSGKGVESFGCLSVDKSWRARDGTTFKYSCTRDVNVTQGIVITPNNGDRKSIVTAIRLYPGRHNPSQTPLSYILSGRADAESPWVYMFDGEFPGVRAGLPKNGDGLVINSTYESGDASLTYSEVRLPNNGDAYLDYKIEFTAVKGGSSTTYLRFAELELPGHLEASVSPTLSPSTTPTSQPTDAPSTPPTSSPSASPSSEPSNSPSKTPTKSPSTAPTSSPSSSPSVDLPDEGDLLHNVLPSDASIVSLGCTSVGRAYQAVDGTTSRYHCTRNQTETQSIIITPGNGRKSILTAMRLYPSDRPRDQMPASYILSGRVGSVSPWVQMMSGDIPGVRETFTQNANAVVINSSFESGDTGLTYFEVGMPHNGDAYLDYKIEFTSMRGGDSQAFLRFGEIELPGHLEASVSPTLSPSTTPTSQPTDAPSTPPTSSPSASPSSEPSNSPSKTPTKSPSTAPTSSPSSSPSVDLPDEGDLLNTVAPPGSSIENFGCVNDVRSWRAIDRTTSVYSCTRDINVTQSIIIAPNNGGRKSIVTAMRLYPSGKSGTLTPLSYILSGRADAESPWVYMFDGDFPGVREGLSRNPSGVEINSTYESGDDSLTYSEVGLPNNGDAYLDYKIEFTAVKGGSSTPYLRFAELELPGHLEASLSPTLSPSISPTKNPTDSPTVTPTAGPSQSPSTSPSFDPTSSPTHPILECPSYLAGRLPLCTASKDSSCEFGLLRYEVLEESSPGASNGILCARVEIPNHDGWVGIGFSDNGSMTGSSIATTAVVGVPSSGTVLKYSLTARDKAGVYLMENQTLRGTSIFIDDADTTIMTFAKLLSETDEVEILTSGLNHFIAAKGGEFFLGDYHTPHYSNRQPGIEKDFSEDVPTSSPSFAPTMSPTTSKPSTPPTIAPSSSPTEPQPSATPTSSPSATPTSKPTFQPTVEGFAMPCPPAGDDPISLSSGSQRFQLSLANSACSIFIRKSTGALVPYARSYGGGVWEASPGPMAASMDSIDCTSSCLVELTPLDDLDDEYILVTKAARSTTNRDQIARWLEMTSFGPRMDEINALDDGVWSVEDRAAHLRQQIEIPMTSHREYFRERANAIWDDTSIPAKSDHPCSPGSKWRRYTYVEQDREYTRDDEYIYTTFETVEAEKDLEYFIFESDSFDEVNVGNGERGFNFRNRAHHSGIGYYDMHMQGDFIEWNITMQEADEYPISFRYASASKYGGGNSPLKLSVNGEVISSAYPFIYTDSWSMYKYSDMIDVTLNSGSNTIRLELAEDHSGPNIDHLRVGKPPAVVMKTNGWARTVLRNGISLLNGWPMVWDETTEVSFRSYPDPPQGDLWLFGANYGRLQLRFPTGAEKFLEAGNPPVDFTGYEQYLPNNYFSFDHLDVWSNTTSDMWDGTPLLEGQEMLLVNGIDSAVCDFIPAFAEEASLDAPIFGRLPDDSWVQWTPTIQLEPNGPAHNAPPSQRSSSTLADGGGSTVISTNERTKCANVPRSPFNDDTCILSTESTACAPFEVIGEVPVDLNATNIEAIYDLTGRLVYAIRGLGLDLIEQHVCSGSKTRWEYEVGTCDSPSSLGNNTRKAIVSALSSGTVPPDYFKDIKVRARDCDATDITLENLNIKIQTGAYCVKQVHPDDWNVYDFTVWASRHPGGSYNIQKWATDTFQSTYETNGWQLDYPFKASPDRPEVQEHPMNRWETNGKRPNVEFIGTFGSTVAYRDLPNDLKLQEVSDYFGATAEPVTGGGVVVCGSAGEVSNDPFKRQVFDFDSNEERTTRDDVMDNQKHVVWSEIALNGEDQLRQRMAWALCQIVTTVPSNIDARFQTEIYTEYYDICVKHAFGNYRNLLKEASYSPLMAEHLSYLKSKSHEYVYRTENRRIARADENFAREVMQLFTIGLFSLNDDGTPVLDNETNKPLETYTNEDIESFSRAWTGFERVGVRGNYEEVRGGSENNRLDPMRIDPSWRDAFPKPDLDGGFVGDRYALCVDLPDRSFLKAGAKYRLLGGSPLPQLTSDPSQFAQDSKYPYLLHLELNSTNSDLYKALDADTEGQYAMTVTLQSDIECFGVECKLDTIRTVKIGSVYYEFVEKPCVELSFFEGKQISRRENKLFGAMCANPKLAHASEACCREERLQEVRSADKVPGVTFFYEAERMKYDTAHDRCVDYGKDLCFFEKTRIQDTPNDGFRKGYSWTNLDCSINVKINKEGYIAIVHDAELSSKNEVDSQGIPSHLEENDTQNWFWVQWEGPFPGSSESDTCASFGCKTLASGDCLCKTSLNDTPVFQDLSTTNKTDILSRLFIGAPGIPSNSEPDASNPDFVAHKVHGVLDEHTVLEVNDDKGRTFLLKNVLSTVTLEGWAQLPAIYGVDEISSNSSVVYKSHGSASSGDIVDFLDDDQAFVEWDSISVEADGLYDISFRYSMGTETRTMQLFVNEEEIFLEHAGRPLEQINHIADEPPPESMPLTRCQGDCDSDDECGDGLFCLKMDGNEGYFPGCSGLPSGNGRDYCVDPSDSVLPIFLPTGGFNQDWRHWSTQVFMNAGVNTIRLKVAHMGESAPNIDYLKVEGVRTPTSASFRNPPHFVSHIVNKDNLGEKNVRDAMYETDAVLDHYIFHDNTAPFLCHRIMQRFGLSNPSPRYVKECTKAFRSGKYAVSDEISFGSEEYGSLEATIAAVLLDKEATDEAISQDMSHRSLREPILKVMHLLRSQNFEAVIPVSPTGLPMARDYHLRLWKMNLKIGQSPYEFPTVFSWFLPEFVADVGPTLDAKLVSPEALVSTMPNTLGILNGMFSLIKYGLTDCFQGFSTNPSIGDSCASQSSSNSAERYSKSYGRLAFEPSGHTTAEYLGELATLLTAGRLSDANRAEILAACDSNDKASAVRCIQQLLITTGEFHSTNTQTPTGETRIEEEVRVESDEPYKAIVYIYFAGGCDSYSMLTPHTCTRNPNYDVYDRYRSIRGRSDLSEGVGLPRSGLLEIDANNPAQPCETFGIHNNLTVLEELYNAGELTFIANAGLLSRPVDTSNYRKEMPTQLFAHNAMTKETKSEDLFDLFGGTGVGGRLADVLTAKGVPTNTFSIDGQQVLLTGVQGGGGPSPVVLSRDGLPAFNQYPELPHMNQVILNLNNVTSPDSGFFAETWSHGLADSLSKQAILKDAIDAATIKSNVTAEDLNNKFLRELIMCTRIMQTRETRGSKRDICYVSEGGFDMHSNVLEALMNKFTSVNFALGKFVQEVKALGLWTNVTVVQFSEFGRTLDPNSGDGVDHAWGGNHFVFGGSIDGGKVRGLYPHDFVQSSTNPIALSRGRLIPTTPWDASLAGVAEWFGADKGSEMEKVLPMHSNFDSSVIFDEAELYKSEGTVEAPASITSDAGQVPELTVSADVSLQNDEGELSHLEVASDVDNDSKLLGIATKEASSLFH